jgi:hypothetical protein
MSGFTPEQLDFLMGGLHKVSMANVSNIVLNLESIDINNASTMQGGLLVAPIYPAMNPFAASLAQAYGASNCGVLRSSVGTVFSLAAMNVSGAAKQYIQLHNSAVAVASGAVPLRSFLVGAAGTDLRVGHEVFTMLGENFSLGVTYAWSTVPHVFTQADGNNYQLEVRLK